MRKSWISVATAAVLLLCPSAFAGLGTSLMQSAPVAETGDFEFKIQNDIIFKRGEFGGGFNLVPHLRTGLIEPFADIDLYFGTGTTDFQFGATGKFNLLPDVEGQAGLSFLASAAFIRDSEVNAGLFGIGAVVSKAFDVDFGQVEPYGALQFEWFMNPADDVYPISLLVGSRWSPNDTKPWHFYSEFTVDLHDSLWGLALGAGYPF